MSEADQDIDPAEAGFRAGLEIGRAGSNPLPYNPYPLRSAERRQWSAAYVAGKRLGRQHRDEAERAVAEMLEPPRERVRSNA